MNFFETFGYVDAYWDHPKTQRRSKWQRLMARDVWRSIVQIGGGSNCFMSVQRFRDAISNRPEKPSEKKKEKNGHDHEQEERERAELEPDTFAEQQLHYHGLYFDFDASEKTLPDVEPEDRLLVVNEQVRLLVAHLQTKFELTDAHIQVWFSGAKGFHVQVRPEPLGIVPHTNLSYILAMAARDLKNQLELSTLDMVVYSIPRMWRIANTVHQGSGKYKIELSLRELQMMKMPEILDMATHPRAVHGDNYLITGVPGSHIWSEAEYREIAKDTTAAYWWAEYVSQYEAAKEMKNLRPRKLIVAPEGGDSFPVCVKDIRENGPKPGSIGRNRVLLPLVGFYKDAALSKDTALHEVHNWTKQHFAGEPHLLKERQANGKSVVDAVYKGAHYHFSCASMLSNKGTGAEGRIACAGDECPWVKNKNDQLPAEVPQLHLAEASRAAYIGTKVKIAVHVSGIGKSPYAFPSKVEVECHPKEDKDGKLKFCPGCPNQDTDGNKSEAVLTAANREVLALVDVNDPRKRGTLRQFFGVAPKCYNAQFTEVEKGNVEQVKLIPMVDFANAYQEQASDMSKFATRHVVRNGYYLGHGIVANKKYVVDAYPFEHPEDQSVVFQFEKIEAATNDIDQFKMTPELYKQLQIFWRREGQSVEDKLKEIQDDFEVNVHRIRGRQDLSTSVDLAYHSIIGFPFQGNMVTRGWFELLVLGDSGTGKTTLVERLMQHFGLGELIAGEEAKRTGLTYAVTQEHGNWMVNWGKLPQNDRRLLIIDEFAAIPGEEVGKLTQIRSEGKARGQGVASNYETWARTRLILLSNPKSGESLGGHNYGIEAIRDLFDEHQDLRRTDLAVVVKTNDVDVSIVNMKFDAQKHEHRFTADLCRQLVLWAWSRDPQHVEFLPGSEERILWWAEVLGKTYASDVYLADRSDLRIKIARISCAVAARLFSTDNNAKKVLVAKDHVDFAAKHMDKMYRKPAMGYWHYARKHQRENELTPEQQAKIRKVIEAQPAHKMLVSKLLELNYFSRNELAEALSYDKQEIEDLWRSMVKYNLVKRTAKSHKKTQGFTEILRNMSTEDDPYGTPPDPEVDFVRPPVQQTFRIPGEDDDDPTPAFTTPRGLDRATARDRVAGGVYLRGLVFVAQP